MWLLYPGERCTIGSLPSPAHNIRSIYAFIRWEFVAGHYEGDVQTFAAGNYYCKNLFWGVSGDDTTPPNEIKNLQLPVYSNIL